MHPPKEEPILIPKVKETGVEYDRFVKIRRDRLSFFGQEQDYDYFILETKAHAVVVLGLTPEGSLILTEEYRHPAGKILLGCAGGYIDQGETPLMAAKREFLEETGYSAATFEIIGCAYPYPGLSSQYVIYTLAKNAVCTAKQTLEPSETIRIIVKTEDELKKMIADGTPVDGILCTALFFWRLRF